MKAIHLVMQAHKPFRLKRYGMFEIGQHSHYFHHDEEQLVKAAKHSLEPVNAALQAALQDHQHKFKFSLSVSGSLLEHLERFAPDVLASFVQLVQSGRVELLAQPYHHSLAYLYSQSAFADQVRAHQALTQQLLNAKGRVLRNTALLYDDNLARQADMLGLTGIIAPHARSLLAGKQPSFTYKPAQHSKITVLVEHSPLSQEVQQALNVGAHQAALRIAKELSTSQALTINLQYDQLKEHKELQTLIGRLINQGVAFLTASELITSQNAQATLQTTQPITKFDAFLGPQWWDENDLQRRAMQGLWELYDKVRASNDEIIINDWGRLSASDHFGCMCMQKGGATQGAWEHVERHDSPYEVFIAFMNACEDLEQRADKVTATKPGT